MARKSRIFLGIAAALLLGLAPALVEAAAGRSSSQGSRGSRTDQAVPQTQTAPSQARPMERSATQPQTGTTAARPGQATAPAAAQQQSWFQRNPFMAGMMGGLIGAGIGGLLFGNGFGGLGDLGGTGMLGLLLQIALIGGLAYLIISFIRRRNQARQMGAEPAYATANAGTGPMERQAIDVNQGGQAGSISGGAAPRPGDGGSDEIGVTNADLDRFDQMLGKIQASWSKSDIGALRGLLTPEMLSYFSEQLSEEASKGIKSIAEQVTMDQGSVAESWAEGNAEYATVALRFSALDYTIENASGRVVEGSKTERVARTEIWTFMRHRGGSWLLSAIQQAS
ncbi:MAG: hypothetical protein FJX52_04275 [Alphaproteobacteria bacterium]|nr:hypothetical protein [Alphaproteobacteria bacterium]